MIFPARNLHLWLGFSMAMLNYQMIYDFNNYNYMIWIDMGVIRISGKFILVSLKSTS